MTNKEQRLLALWFLFNLGLGILIMQDFGISIDEESNFLYAEASIKAYSSFFGLLYQPFYGAGIITHYGPAFLILVYFPVKLASQFFPHIPTLDFWHFSYFITFQLAGLSLYLMLRRWFSKGIAGGVLILFTTQPLLWGHAFINPKDIPFMFFFTFSILTGFWMVDAYDDQPLLSLSKRWSTGQYAFAEYRRKIGADWTILPRPTRTLLLRWSVFSNTVLVLLGIFSEQITEPILTFFYFSKDGSWPYVFFRELAPQWMLIPIVDYAHKANLLFLRGIYGLLFANLISLFGYSYFVVCKKKKGDCNGFVTKKIFFDLWHDLKNYKVILAGCVLGLSNSVRILGLFASGIVILYFLFRKGMKSTRTILVYLLWAVFASYLSWPYLWQAPLAHYSSSIAIMANFPWRGKVLFDGVFYRPTELPLRYLPTLMGIQFTEPIVLLVGLGLILLFLKLFKKTPPVDFFLFFFLGFLFVFGMLIFSHAPLYDNFRQILFIVPPLFVLVAIALEAIVSKFRYTWLSVIFVIILALPGIYQIIELHPYSYTYYNSFVGGLEGAFRRYESEYWATSFREHVEVLNEIAEDGALIGVSKHFFPLLRPYLRPDLQIIDFRSEQFNNAGGYLILSSRANADQYYQHLQNLFVVERQGAIFSVLRYIGKLQ